MAKQRPFDKCKLCGEVRQLCDSHYLPKRLYPLMRASELKNPNPVMSVNGQLKQVSAQYRGFVFCESCEDRLNKMGEKWVLANLTRKHAGGFPLQDALAPLTPTAFGDRWERYDILGTTAFDVQKLIYFSVSVFWRGSAHNWKTNIGQKAPTVDLGMYAEPLRRFLLGDTPFPDDVALMLDIWPYKPVLPLLYPVVTERLSEEVCRYWFCVPGLQFFLFVGTNIPEDVRGSKLTSGIVTVDAGAADALWEFIKGVLKAQVSGTNMEALRKEVAKIKESKK